LAKCACNPLSVQNIAYSRQELFSRPRNPKLAPGRHLRREALASLYGVRFVTEVDESDTV
jgi:hypothetical protein